MAARTNSNRLRIGGLAPETAPASDGGAPRGAIGVRWWVGPEREIHLGWPAPGAECDCTAIGWVAADGAYGVIEVPRDLLPNAVLDVIDGRFPGRRWFQGTWDSGDEITTQAA